MAYDPKIHHRHSIRLKNWDYSKQGYYFITICTQDRGKFFGNIVNKKMDLSILGNIIKNEWLQIPIKYINVKLDEWIIMPNHLHGIIIIALSNTHTPAISNTNTPAISNTPATTHIEKSIYAEKSIYIDGATVAYDGATVAYDGATARVAPTLGNIIGSFKSLCIHHWLKHIKKNNINTLGKFWQRNFYERIIRNESELNRVREYIKHNPLKWEFNSNNSENLLM